MDIKVGEYIRTPYNEIEKVIKITKENGWTCVATNKDAYELQWLKNNKVKHSKNIIDLIEVGDIVNNGYIYEVGKTKDGHKWVHSLNGLLLFENDIKTILTHEQMEENQYVVKRNMETN